MVVKEKQETFAPVTLGHIRSHGCRDLLVYSSSGGCHHSATMNADWLPDETPVRSLCPGMVCTHVCKFPLRHRRSPTPVFLRLSLHRGRSRVLALDPMRRAT
jgi:hypothetical protein